jgi:hypothetical protein
MVKIKEIILNHESRRWNCFSRGPQLHCSLDQELTRLIQKLEAVLRVGYRPTRDPLGFPSDPRLKFA